MAVARERHFARAAESCYVSQPALSTSIAKLERELSVTLINRGQNFEGLTPEGERLVVWAKRVLAEHDALKAEAAASGPGSPQHCGSGRVPRFHDCGASRGGLLRASPAGQGQGLLTAVFYRAAPSTA